MKEVTINKQEALSKVEANLILFKEEYAKALEEFRIDANQLLLDAISKISTSTATLRLQLQAPTDHSAEYIKIIAMLEMSIKDDIVLSIDEFDCYILNNWHFVKALKDLRMGYTSNAH